MDFVSCQEQNCSGILEELLLRYPQEHYCAFYDFKDEQLISLLNSRTLIFDEEYEEELHASFIPVASKGLMHHKFCIFNREHVLTGSWNPTTRGTQFNDNYILLLRSPDISEYYFDMYLHLLDRDHDIQPLQLNNGTSSLRLITCPLHDCQGEVLAQLRKAKDSVKILAFTFTDQDIAEELLGLSRKGVDVEVIYEKTRITRYSTIYDFAGSDVVVFHDGNSYTMHEKMIIIDEEFVFLGSYNPTKSATLRNDENLLFIEDDMVVGNALAEYQKIRGEALRVDLYK